MPTNAMHRNCEFKRDVEKKMAHGGDAVDLRWRRDSFRPPSDVPRLAGFCRIAKHL